MNTHSLRRTRCTKKQGEDAVTNVLKCEWKYLRSTEQVLKLTMSEYFNYEQNPSMYNTLNTAIAETNKR